MSNTNHAGRPVDPNSAHSRAAAIYDSLNAVSKATSAAIVDALVTQLGVKRGTAQVYLHDVRKARGLTQKRPRVAKPETTEDKGTADVSVDAQPVATADVSVDAQPVAKVA